jgi:hypothetical protein
MLTELPLVASNGSRSICHIISSVPLIVRSIRGVGLVMDGC